MMLSDGILMEEGSPYHNALLFLKYQFLVYLIFLLLLHDNRLALRRPMWPLAAF